MRGLRPWVRVIAVGDTERAIVQYGVSRVWERHAGVPMGLVLDAIATAWEEVREWWEMVKAERGGEVLETVEMGQKPLPVGGPIPEGEDANR